VDGCSLRGIRLRAVGAHLRASRAVSCRRGGSVTIDGVVRSVVR
jgi:hypothetical protein